MKPKSQPISRMAFLRGSIRTQPQYVSDESHPSLGFAINISNACLSANGITCRTCEEQCEEGAISFKLAVGGIATARIGIDACTGCGACMPPCPVNAINIEEHTV